MKFEDFFLSNDNVWLGKLNKETFWTFQTTLTLSYSIILTASLNSVNTYFKRAHKTQHHESKRRLHSSAHFTYLWAWLPRQALVTVNVCLFSQDCETHGAFCPSFTANLLILSHLLGIPRVSDFREDVLHVWLSVPLEVESKQIFGIQLVLCWVVFSLKGT